MNDAEQKKLERFKMLILEEVEQKADEIISTQQKFNDDKISQIENTQQSIFETEIEKYKVQLENAYRKEVSKVSYESKKELIFLNSKLMNEIYQETKQKLLDFTFTDKYQSYLLEQINSIQDKSNYSNGKIFIKPNDEKYIDKIKKAMGFDCEIVLDNTIEIGGVRLLGNNGNVIINFTLEEKLSEKYDTFVKSVNLLD